MDEYWNHISDSEDESAPLVKEIILPPSLFQHAIRRGYETYKEVGFYLIGLFKKGVCYIHDIIEFDYSEQSGGFIESGMARYVRLKAGLPLGLQIVGHMHKHPGFTQYSATDKRNFLRYGNANLLNAFLIYIVEPSEEIRGYTATSEKIYPVDVNIRDLTPEEELLEKKIRVQFNTKIVLPKSSTYSDLYYLFSERISSEALKHFSRPTIQIEGNVAEESSQVSVDIPIKIIPRKAVEIADVGNNPRLKYRIFMKESETVAELGRILKELTNLPKERGYELVFYEKKRKLLKSTKIKDIEDVLEWDWEKAPAFPIIQSFAKLWNGIIGILQHQQSGKVLERKELEEVELSRGEKFLETEESLEIPISSTGLINKPNEEKPRKIENEESQSLKLINENKYTEAAKSQSQPRDKEEKIEEVKKEEEKRVRKYRLDYFT
ncbi:MAG: hypothetical protein ACTSRS_13260 [Candidatus Helarchaeota archaeon]